VHDRTKPNDEAAPGDSPGDIIFDAGARGAWNKLVNGALLPNRRYVERETGYVYQTDDHGRVYTFSGTLVRLPGNRNTYQQSVAGRADRATDDQGGHLFATVFRGPGERINLVPMNSNLNQGVWKAMENRWAEALDRGSVVEVEVDVVYEKDSKSARPIRFAVSYTVDDGKPIFHNFNNAPGGRQ
jgi:filamentous hemagglutinin